MLYNPPSGSTDANAPYVGKNTAGGTQGSKVPPAAVEFTQRELVALIAASGQAPTNTVLVQAAMALARGIFVGNLTGSGELAVATLGVVLPSLLQGMKIGGVATATNTTTAPKLRVVNLGSASSYTDFPIIKEDGSALAVGDIKTGRRYRYEADGAGNVMISGGGLSAGDISTTLAAKNISGRRVVTFSTAGSLSWTPPSDCTTIEYELVGGGGGGGGALNNACAASGGGGGGYVHGVQSVTPGVAITGTVGAAGTAGAAGGGNGGNGGATSLGGFATANGGTNGKGSSNGVDFSANPGGSATGGSIENRTGGGAGIGYQVGGSLYTGGLGGPSPLTGAVSPLTVSASGGGAAGLGGGGGGASLNAPGGVGGSGFIRIYY